MSVVAPVEIGFGLAEDQAMKAKVSGLVLPIKGQDSEVPVRFRFPEGEFNPQGQPTAPSGISYPLITIDQTTVTYDRKRDHVNYVAISYVPDMAPELPDPDRTGDTLYPLPVQIGYQVTTWARSAQHNVMLRAALLAPDRLPIRFGWIYVGADDTWRQIDSMGVRSDHFIDDQKRRIFRNIFTLLVDAELLKTTITQDPVVETVHLDPPTHVPDDMHGVH